MTEQEAGEKWCPMVRHYTVGIDDHSGNRSNHLGGPTSYHCIGSRCMAWRLVITANGLPTFNDSGYCGLAGKP